MALRPRVSYRLDFPQKGPNDEISGEGFIFNVYKEELQRKGESSPLNESDWSRIKPMHKRVDSTQPSQDLNHDMIASLKIKLTWTMNDGFRCEFPSQSFEHEHKDKFPLDEITDLNHKVTVKQALGHIAECVFNNVNRRMQTFTARMEALKYA